MGGTMQTPLLLTAEETAKELGIGRTRVFALIGSGEITSVKIGRTRRIPREALQAYVDGLLAGSAIE
jgi:excisionase family DNA binding protein